MKSNVDYNEFILFVNGRLAKAYASAHGIEQDAAISEIVSKIENTTPVPHGATKVSSDATTSRLTMSEVLPTEKGSRKQRILRCTRHLARGGGLEGSIRDHNYCVSCYNLAFLPRENKPFKE
ncbi:hypothetical protein FGIG_05249 [Fasciola gigantica]|uniref:Uncharacterized protein n=1 Tax=Fasciola gigantica TaxID=46835 RepID=A0A504YY96_FASGI|nr:hypothetical protein FGIG_05249 [Fasciola gigantica]